MALQLTVSVLSSADYDDILTFEQQNRGFFAGTIGDRGDAFFSSYPQRHADLLSEMERGDGLFYVVRDEQGSLVGRVNMTRLRPGPASLGYRFAQHIRGRGYASIAVAEALAQARKRGIRQVIAVVALDNPASKRVLEKTGFIPVSETEQRTREVERNGVQIAVQTFVLDSEVPPVLVV